MQALADECACIQRVRGMTIGGPPGLKNRFGIAQPTGIALVHGGDECKSCSSGCPLTIVRAVPPALEGGAQFLAFRPSLTG